jgi:uncharacterized SAM-binding protein YcdF (DUF218 family)
MYFILILLGILFLAYFICIAFFVGHGTNFFFIWLFLGVGLILFALLWRKGFFEEYVALWLRRMFIIVVGVCGLLFVIVEGCIISGFSYEGEPDLDYLVVLGAQMKATGPSKALQYRLDKAIAYLEENSETKVIVSGGQGADEHVSEAQGMYDYLTRKGVAYNRIIMEDRSRNTFENLTFSAQFLDKENATVGVVSNNFHVFRAVKIAQKAGYENVCGIAARGEPFLQYNNMMREFFGVVKDFLVGNM